MEKGFEVQEVKSLIMIPYDVEYNQWQEPITVRPEIEKVIDEIVEGFSRRRQVPDLHRIESATEESEKIGKMTKLFGPTTAICNYGFGGFEGMKARRSKVNERMVLIPTPEFNFRRIQNLIRFYNAEECISQELPEKYWIFRKRVYTCSL